MTSSWQLTQRKKNPNFYNLGSWDSMYVINGAMRECHPNYVAHPVGSKDGFAICIKKQARNPENKSSPEIREVDAPPERPYGQEINGYHRYRPNLYDMTKQEPETLAQWNRYEDRVVPNEKYLQRNDYLSRELRYNGTGISPMHTPQVGECRFREYSTSSMDEPPVKYDVTRLQQLYPVWKKEQIYMGANPTELDNFDRKYTNNRV